VEFSEGVPYPVDYKHGPKGRAQFASYQLCGQALCLEEMMKTSVPRGAIFHFKSRRRTEIEFGEDLRRETMELARQIREMLSQGRLPPPLDSGRCEKCSLAGICMPAVAHGLKFREAARRLFQVPIDALPVAYAQDQDESVIGLNGVDQPIGPDSESPKGHFP